ncbi:MAG: DsbA family protein [Gammaproteobacteria bacterium]
MIDPLGSDAPLIVYLDIKSPYAFIAKDPTWQMADELGLEFDWRPLTLDIPSFLGSARLDKQGRVAESKGRTPEQWTAVKYAYRDARRHAALQGYTLKGTEKIWDTSLAHIAFWWAKEQGTATLRRFLDRVYPPFWRRELDVEDLATMADVLGQAGADVTGFADYAEGEGRRFHDESQRQIFEAGIFGVPGYVIEGEYFFGREHLPTVRWILGGRRGPQPDVANPGPGPGGSW